MVVLSSALIPSTTNEKLANVLGIELDKNGFILEDEINNPQATSRKGIYVCGCAKGPRDIPDSVASASAASAKAQADVKERIKERVEERKEDEAGITPEEQLEIEEPRIGVFVCSCGINISGTRR